MPKVHKPRHKPVDVSDDQLQSFLDAGFTLCEGEEAATADDDPGMTQAEIDKELAAVESIARKAGVDAGLEEDEITANVEAALAEAKQKLGVE